MCCQAQFCIELSGVHGAPEAPRRIPGQGPGFESETAAQREEVLKCSTSAITTPAAIQHPPSLTCVRTIRYHLKALFTSTLLKQLQKLGQIVIIITIWDMWRL